MHRTEDDNHLNNQFKSTPPATVIGDRWLNSVQEEICNFIEAAGIQLESADTDNTKNQLLLAAQALFATTAAITAAITAEITAAISPLTGTIIAYGGAAAPTGFLMCDGAAVSRSTYSALFAIIGTTFGAGDGATTFNVPNGQAVSLKGAGNQTINTRVKSGPAFGAVQEDQFQAWQAGATADAGGAKNLWAHQGANDTANSGAGVAGYSLLQVAGIGFKGSAAMVKAVDDGTNGTPRTGLTTRDNTLGVNYIIKT